MGGSRLQNGEYYANLLCKILLVVSVVQRDEAQPVCNELVPEKDNINTFS
jgi:hypothetical protein